MKMTRSILLACTALVCMPLTGAAAISQKPGLWSVTVEMGDGLPEIDPRMIEQMEAMGLEIPKPQPIEYEVCLTPEQVSKNVLPDMSDASSGCSSKNVRREGDQLSGDLECHGPLEGTGKVLITLTGAESYTGTSSFQGASREGIPLNMTSGLSGKWMSANCGKVKPLGG